jgi:hypothetical protein
MLELQLRQTELTLKAHELAQKDTTNAIAKEQADTLKFTALHNAALAEVAAGIDDEAAVREENVEYEKMASNERIAAADREAAAAAPPEAAMADQGGGPDGDGGSEGP